MPCIRSTLLIAALVAPVALSAQRTDLPLKHKPKPTSPAISTPDLMTRLYVYADDSMMGRETGTIGHVKATDYVVQELKKLGLEPAGDAGGFIQRVPMLRRAFDTTSTITVDGTVLRGGFDFLSLSRGGLRPLETADVVFGGTLGDTAAALTAEQVNGKVVLFRAAAGRGGRGGRGGGGGRGRGGAGGALAGAAAIATIGEIGPDQVRAAAQPREGDIFMRPADNASRAPLGLTVSPRAAEILLGTTLDAAVKGQAGKTVQGHILFRDEEAPALNVVAIVRGTDAVLRNQYVVIGAHPDHVAPGSPVDHDSLHLYNAARFAIVGLVGRGQQPTPEQRAQVEAIRINLDSVRALRPVRMDSIRNGADDDGSGSMLLLELAEAFARGPVKPRRSIVFIWQTGEEKGLLGSRWFTEHATIPRDSIVAQLNMDMVGRGAATDIPGGGPNYLQLVGSHRLSTELGDLVEEVNKTQAQPFKFDYAFDADGHPENIYCRSDHYNYARWGIPVVFFTTGLHGDYHQATDEPQYIDYPHLQRVGQLVFDMAMRVGNLSHRPVVDKPKPDPTGACRQ